MVRAELPLLYRVAFRITGRADEAEELVAQTLYQAARGWSGFDGRYPSAWLIRILHNAYFKMLKTAQRFEVDDLDLIGDVDAGQDVHREVVLRWSQEIILSALNRLSTEFRLAIILCDIEEMSYDEVQEALGIPRGTLCSRLHRARRQMQNLCHEIGGSLP